MPEIPCKTGVYCWRNKVNGKRYVGGAYSTLTKRRDRHLRNLRRGTHKNRHLQAAWNKYGEANFEFIVLKRCPLGDVEKWEQHWIDFYKAADSRYGYNQSPTARVTLGYRHRREDRARMSALKKGKKQRPEAVAARAEGNRGKKRGPEALANMTAAQVRMGIVHPERRAKVIAAIVAANTGAKRSDEARKRMSVAHKGVPWSAKRRAAFLASKRECGRLPSNV